MMNQDQWFCRVSGGQFGPVPFDAIVELAQTGHLSSGDEVRNSEDESWVAAGSIKGLFAEQPQGACNGSAEGPNKLSRSTQKRDKSEPTTSGAAAELLDRVLPKTVRWEGPEDVPESEDSASATAPPVAPRPVVPKRRRQRKTLFALLHVRPKWVFLALGVILLLVCLRYISFDWTTPDQRIYGAYASFWSEFKELRERKAGESEWAEFFRRVLVQNDPLVEELERTANSAHPVRQHLLWAGRDFLPQMMSDAKSEPSESERRLQHCLEEANRLGDFD